MKRIYILFFSLFLVFQLKAQDMATFFTSMPDELIPQLEEAWRKDLIDLYQSGKTATLENTMNGRSTLVKFTTDYLLVQTTERSTIEIKLLPLVNNTYIACVITSVYAPIPDSRIDFYTTDWSRLSATSLLEPVTLDSFIKKGQEQQGEYFLEGISRLDLELIQYKLHETEQILSATCTTPDYLNQEDCKKVRQVIDEIPRVFRWKLGRFEK